MKKTLLNLGLILSVSMAMMSQTTFGPKQAIDLNTGNNPYAIDSGLIDGDAFIDIIVGTDVDNTLIWYKNNGNKTFTRQTGITNTASGIGNLLLVDLNNDTFLDLLVSGYSSDSVTWYANDGTGNFGPEQLIATVSGASGLAVGRIDNDLTIDVAVTAYDGNKVVWFANDGLGNFGTENIINTSLIAPGSINMKDIDGDGDLDVIVSTAVGSGNVDVIQIFRNNLIPGGTATFTMDAAPVTTGKNYFTNATFEDLDGDGNLDILATELNVTTGTGNFYWYEFNGSGFTETLMTTSIGNPSSAKVKDLDDDGLGDIVLSSGTSGAGNDIVWFKNNGSGFNPELVIDATQSQAYVFTVNDFDNDGDLDIASNAYNNDDLNWFENLKYTLSVSESTPINLTIYPNPAKDQLNFKGFTDAFSVSVYDLLGKKVISTSLIINQSLDVSGLNNGVYILKFDDFNSNHKFIKQ